MLKITPRQLNIAMILFSLLFLALGAISCNYGDNQAVNSGGAGAALDSSRSDLAQGAEADFALAAPPDWVVIPAGTYQMGCSPGDANCGGSEKPTHAVNLPTFQMTRTEITQEQYQDVTSANPSAHTGCPTCPVETVDWYEAGSFCAAIGARLPTEAEWEYAARAGTTVRFVCGNTADCLPGIAWFADNSNGQTQPVAGLIANGFGLYDMLGNVWEWVNDWYDSGYYAVSPADDPPGPATGIYKVFRGGGFPEAATALRVSARISWQPTTKFNKAGFRCARDYTPPTTTSTTTTSTMMMTTTCTFTTTTTVTTEGSSTTSSTPDTTTTTVITTTSTTTTTHDVQPMNWVAVPAGTYMMGCSPGDANCAAHEKPSHQVSIPLFYMTATEITQDQYLEVTGEAPSGHADCSDCPVERVSWDEAAAYCTAIGGRLPTEAQWEYAARGGTTSRYTCGNDAACLPDIAWFADTSGGQSQSVGQLTPNVWGLYDMLGNVWEWVSDWYDASYYASSPMENPQGPATGSAKIFRGGAFGEGAAALRVSARISWGPTMRFNNAGFRCASDTAPTTTTTTPATTTTTIPADDDTTDDDTADDDTLGDDTLGDDTLGDDTAGDDTVADDADDTAADDDSGQPTPSGGGDDDDNNSGCCGC